MTITEDMQDAILKVPAGSWTPAYDGDGQVRDGAWVADITGMLDLSSWPAGMRVIVRKERPHPGAQLRFTDIDGHRFTAFATDAKKGPARGPGTAAPPPGPLRGPDPLRQGHRAAEPAAEGLRPEPAMVRDRRPGLRAAGLDPAARPGRRRPAAGNRNGSGCACSPSPGAWPAAAAACGCASPSDGPGPARSPPRSPACRPSRPADQPEPPLRHGRSNHRGPWNPAHPARQPGSQPSPAPENQPQPNTSGQHVRHAKD